MRFLARREHSRAELRRKLLKDDVDAATLDLLLDDLESKKLLSDRRFADMLAQSKGARYGVASLSRVLDQQGVSAEVAASTLAPLRETEQERAMDLWRRRFSEPAPDIRARARQHRFLLGRGFDPATVAWVLKKAGKPPADDSR